MKEILSNDYIAPEGQFANVGGGNIIHYHDLGEGDPVIFLHGGGPGASGWSNFKENAREFVKNGFRVLLPDAIGYGYSSKPNDVEYTLEFLASGVVGLAKAIGLEKFNLIGNSMGGAMSIKIALDHPELVERLILLAPAGLADVSRLMEMPGTRGIFECMLGEEGPTVDKVRSLFELQLYDRTLITDEIVYERQKIAMTQPREVFSTMKVPSQAERISEIKCPVLTFWGVKDQFCPLECANLLAEGPADSRVLIVNNCGHWLHVEKPELFNKSSMDFLKEGNSNVRGTPQLGDDSV